MKLGVLSQEEIIRRVSLRNTGSLPQDTSLRAAAVLVPFLWNQGQWELLFTRRTETVQTHKGQVSFPGGGHEPGDKTPEDTALREAVEEIGLNPADVTVLGRMSRFNTISRYHITPVIGRIPWPYPFTLSEDEVSRVFTVPLDWLADTGNWEKHPRVLPSGKVEDVIYYRQYDGETLWGISARITLDLIQVLQS
jgi:8-oxo-dGTP pyrophosphatase MutT (NUDIX family)